MPVRVKGTPPPTSWYNTVENLDKPLIDRVAPGMADAIAQPKVDDSSGWKDPITGNPGWAEIKGFLGGALQGATKPSTIAGAVGLGAPSSLPGIASQAYMGLGGAAQAADPTNTPIHRFIGSLGALGGAAGATGGLLGRVGEEAEAVGNVAKPTTPPVDTPVSPRGPRMGPPEPSPAQLQQSKQFQKLQDQFSLASERRGAAFQGEQASAQAKAAAEAQAANRHAEIRQAIQDAVESGKLKPGAPAVSESMSAPDEAGLGTQSMRTTFKPPRTKGPGASTIQPNEAFGTPPAGAPNGPPPPGTRAGDIYQGWKNLGSSEEDALHRAAGGVEPPSSAKYLTTIPGPEPAITPNVPTTPTPTAPTQPVTPQAAPIDPAEAAGTARADAFMDARIKPVPPPMAGNGLQPDDPVTRLFNPPPEAGQPIRGAYGKPENAGQILPTPMPAGMQLRELRNLLSAQGEEITPEIQAGLDAVRSRATGQKGIPTPQLPTGSNLRIGAAELDNLTSQLGQQKTQPPFYENRPNPFGESAEPPAIDDTTNQQLSDLEQSQSAAGKTPGSIANIPSQEPGVNELDKMLSTDKGRAQTAAMRAAALAKRKLGGSESGQIDPTLAARVGLGTGGGLIGGATDPLGDSKTGEHHRLLSALLGAGIGAALPSLPKIGNLPETIGTAGESDTSKLNQLTRLRNTGMLSPVSLAKKVAGDVGGLAHAGATDVLTGNTDRASDLLRALTSKEGWQQAAEAGREGWHQPVTEDASGLENVVQKSPLSWIGRGMQAATAGTKNFLDQAGYSPEEQQYYTFTGQPNTTTGQNAYSTIKNNSLLQHVVPFARMGINRIERGLDYSPAGLITARKLSAAGDLEGAKQALARAGIGTGVAAGAEALTPDDFVKNHPLASTAIAALGGPSSIPMAVGMGIGSARKAKDYGSQVAAGSKIATRDIPGFRTVEELASGTASIPSEYLSGYTNFLNPIPAGIDPTDPNTKVDSTTLKRFLETTPTRALANIPGIREELPKPPPQKLRFRIKG